MDNWKDSTALDIDQEVETLPDPKEEAGANPEPNAVQASKAVIFGDYTNQNAHLIVVGLFFRLPTSNLIAPTAAHHQSSKQDMFYDVEIVVNDYDPDGKLTSLSGICRLQQEGWSVHHNGSPLSLKLLNPASGLQRSVVAICGPYSAGKSFVTMGLKLSSVAKHHISAAVPKTKGFAFVEPFEQSSFLILDTGGWSTPVPNSAEAINNSLCTDLLIRAVSYETADTFIYVTSALTLRDQKALLKLHQNQANDSKNASIFVIHNCKDVLEMTDFQSYMHMVKGVYPGSWFEMNGARIDSKFTKAIAAVLDAFFCDKFLAGPPSQGVIYLRQPLIQDGLCSADTPTITHFFLTNNRMKSFWNNATLAAIRETLGCTLLKRPPSGHPFNKMTQAIRSHLGDLVQVDYTKPTMKNLPVDGVPPVSGYLLCPDEKTRAATWTQSTIVDETPTQPTGTVFRPNHLMISHADFIELKLEVPGCIIQDIQLEEIDNHTLDIRIAKKRPERVDAQLVLGVLDLPRAVDGLFTTRIDFSMPAMKDCSPRDLERPTLELGVLTLRFPKRKRTILTWN